MGWILVVAVFVIGTIGQLIGFIPTAFVIFAIVGSLAAYMFKGLHDEEPKKTEQTAPPVETPTIVPVEVIEPVPTWAEFRDALLAQYCSSPRLIEGTLLRRILGVFAALYAPRNQAQYSAYFSACLQSLVNFTTLAPELALEPPESNSAFRQSCRLRELSLEPEDKGLRLRPEYNFAYTALALPFRNSQWQLTFLDWDPNITGPAVHWRDPTADETKQESNRYMNDFF